MIGKEAPPLHPLSGLRDLFRSLGVNDETEGERETLDDGDHLEILQTGLERLAVWVTAGGRGSNDCIARRARFLFFVTDFDSRDKSWADHARETGDSPQLVFEVKENFSKVFQFNFSKGYASKNKKLHVLAR